jgi:hypothetical protein
MIERIAEMPPGTIGFRAAGHMTRDDYANVLIPDLREAVDAGRGLRTMYVIEDLHGIEPRALWEDGKLGFDLTVHHRDAWIRSAIVTDVHWLAQAVRMFAWMIPGEARIFEPVQLEQAKAWVAGDAA